MATSKKRKPATASKAGQPRKKGASSKAGSRRTTKKSAGTGSQKQAKKTAAKKATAKKATSKKSSAKKTTANKAAARKTTTKKVVAKRAASKKDTVKKATAKKSSEKTARTTRSAGQRAQARAQSPRVQSGGTIELPDGPELDQLRERLATQREQILDLYNHDLKIGQQTTDDGTEDIVDRANNAYHREFAFSISDGEREQLLLIEEAQQRLESGSFGSCSHCGTTISMLRLQAVPWARFCIDCQELDEKGLLREY